MKSFNSSILQVHDIDAIHPGYGFLSERSDFAAACEANGIAFIGPRAHVMAKMGDKVSARQSALEAGLPIIPGTDTALSDSEVHFLSSPHNAGNITNKYMFSQCELFFYSRLRINFVRSMDFPSYSKRHTVEEERV